MRFLLQQFVYAGRVQHPLAEIFKLGRRHGRQFLASPTRESAEALLDLPLQDREFAHVQALLEGLLFRLYQ